MCQRFCHFPKTIVTLFAYLRIDVFHPFVCIHVVGTTAKFMVFVVVSVYHKVPVPTFPGVASQHMLVKVTAVIINENSLTSFHFFGQSFKNRFGKLGRAFTRFHGSITFSYAMHTCDMPKPPSNTTCFRIIFVAYSEFPRISFFVGKKHFICRVLG